MKHVHWITAEPYNWPVLIYVGTWAQFRAYLRRSEWKVDMGEGRFDGGFHAALYNPRLGNASVVWLPIDPRETMQGVRALSHELLHAAFSILRTVKVPIGYRNQEALAYLHEGLNRLAHRELNA